MSKSHGPVSWRLEDGLGWIRLDDGRVNALNGEMLRALDAALDGVAGARAVVLEGRDGRFSGGLDLNTLPSLPQAELAGVLKTFGRLCRRLLLHPRPVVAAATGHAIAGGAVILMACDYRVGAAGEFRYGLNEVAIGVPMPTFVIRMAEARLPAHTLRESVLHGRLYGPEEAVGAGFLDEVSGNVVESARAAATRLAALPDPAFPLTKARMAPSLDEALRLQDEEMALFATDDWRRYAERFRKG